MTELQRKMWRFKAGYYLREKLRDEFEEEVEDLRAQGMEAFHGLRDVMTGSTNEGRVAREFDRAADDAVREARMARFPGALRFFQTAVKQLESIDEIWRARRPIEATERKLLETGRLLGCARFTTLEDAHILIIRAREFYEMRKYPRRSRRMTRLVFVYRVESLHRRCRASRTSG